MNQTQALLFLEKNLKEINQTPMGRRLFLSSLPMLLAGCSTSQTRHREGDNTGQVAALTVGEEEKMTRDYLPKMEKEYPIHRNRYLQSYISNIGNSIVSANNLHKKPYSYNFRVVDAKMVNAFALPAGEVFVTAPLIKMCSSEAELAGVIGHEIGHIQARHSAERIHKAKKEESKSMWLGLAGGLLGGAAGFALAKKLCEPQDKECIKRITLYGGAAGAGGALLIQKFAFMANSREDEMEADRIGFKTSYKAGYDNDHIGKFYENLLIMEQKHQKGQNALTKSFADALSTHPPSKERVKQMKEMAATYQNKGKVSSPSFRKVKKIIS